MITKKEILTFCEQLFPQKLAANWDNCGTQSFSIPTVIHQILITLDITPEVVDLVKTKKIDLIIHHHPFLFPNKRKAFRNPERKAQWKWFKKNQVGLLALHTNFDDSPHGMNQQILKKLAVKQIIPRNQKKHQLLSGILQPTPIRTLIDQIKKLFCLKIVQYYGSSTTEISKIIVTAGAGGSDVRRIKPAKGLLFITGEAKWSDMLCAQAKKINMLILGHEMENIFVEIIKNFLKNLPVQIITQRTVNHFNFY